MKSGGPNGRPAVGAIAGFFLGLFIAIDLLLLNTIRLDSPLVIILPVVGLILGAILGWLGPLSFLRRGH